MIKKILLMTTVLFLLAGCMIFPGSAGTQPTAIPTLGTGSAPGATIAQGVLLGGKESSNYKVWIYSAPNPPIRGANAFEAVVVDATGKPVNGAKLSFDIDMTNMSHGKNVTAATEAGDGHYTGKLSFQMPGPWRVLVNVQQGDKSETLRFDFTVNMR